MESIDKFSAIEHAHVLPSTDAGQHRFHLLDGLRGIAALLVVLWHAPAAIYPHGHHSNFLAVDFFFCLSGFVVAFSYERRLQNTFTFLDFSAARIIRLYPIYFLGIVSGAILYHTNLSKLQFLVLFLKQLFMLPSYIVHTGIFLFPLDFPSWSVFFELLTNLIFAALVRLRLARLWHLGMLAFVSLTILLSSHATRQTIDVGAASILTLFVPSLARASFSFVLGASMLRIHRKCKVELTDTRLNGLIAILIAAALSLLLQSPLSLMQNRAAQIVDITVIFPLLILIASYVVVPRTWIPLCALLGDLSYPIYLLHIHVSYLVMQVFGLASVSGPSNHSERGLIALAAAACLVLFCFLVNKYYDVPVRRYLRRRYSRLVTPHPDPITARAEA